MYILSKVKHLKSVTGAKNSDKNNDKPHVPKEPQYTPVSTFDNTQVKIYNGNEKYIHFGIEQQVTENLKIMPNLVVFQDHGLHTGFKGVNFEYTFPR